MATPRIQPDSAETSRLLRQIRNGDGGARGRLLERHLPTIRKCVARRIDPRLQPRVDLSDVVQETQLDLVNRLDDYLRRDPMPFRLWVLKTAHERLLKIERFHLQTAKRAIDREIPLPDRSSVQLARHFVGRGTTPDSIVSHNETVAQVRRVLARLPESDREIITLRNFEGLTNRETSQVLDVTPETSKKRYTRALIRLEQLFTEAGLTGGDT